MYFVCKRVETKPSCLHKLPTFLKYHIPLTKLSIIFYFPSFGEMRTLERKSEVNRKTFKLVKEIVSN